MSDVVGTALLLLALGLVAGLSSWGMLGALVAIRRGIGPGVYFTSGIVAARVVQGLIGGGAALAASSGLKSWFDPSPITYAIIMLAGVGVFIAALVTKTRASSRPEPLPATPRSVADETQTDSATYRLFLTSFGLTLISPRGWVLTALAVSAVGQIPSREVEEYALYVIYLAATVWFQLGLLSIRIFRPRQAGEALDRVEAWGRSNGRTVAGYAGMALGGGLVVLGAVGFWG